MSRPQAVQNEPEHPVSDRVSPTELDVLLRVRDSLRAIRFGTVLIVVQDGNVVQIETAEKIRLR
ncbi:MAG TPA: YezD family protein [Actinomycetota bacterium]|nr:YezD family protein [Actinomycetota bacterium]